MKTLLTLVVTCLTWTLFAQEYQLSPEIKLKSLSNNEGEVILNDGTSIEGNLALTLYSSSKGTQRIVSVRVQNGEKNDKFKPNDIKELKIKSKTSDVTAEKSVVGEVVDAMSESDSFYYIFRSVPDHKGKERLMQLLNPGLDSKVSVYADAKSNQMSFAAFRSGDSSKTYYLYKDGDKKSLYLKKGKYSKLFPKIFKDCPAMTEKFEKAKFKDFAEHIHYYELECD